jgi:hypothetical protein
MSNSMIDTTKNELCSVALALALAMQLASHVEAAPAGDLTAFLAQHCYRCHGEKKQSGEFRLDTLARDFSQPNIAGRWVDMIEKINSGEMPPEGEPRPSAPDRARFVEAVLLLIEEGKSARLARREPVSLRKLTREEYANTLEDLLGVHYVPADPGGLPQDPEHNGFERLGSALSLSPSHVEKYIAIARSVLAEALPETPPTPIQERRPAYRATGNPADWKRLEEQGLAAKVRAELGPNGVLRRLGPPSLRADGVYRARISVSGLRAPRGEAPHLVVYAEDLDRVLYEQDIIAPEDKPVTLEFTTHLPAGNHSILFYNTAQGPSFNIYSSRDGGAYSPFFTVRNSGRAPWQNKLTDEKGTPIWPFLILDWVEWEGPLAPAAPLADQLPTDWSDRAALSAAVTRLAERAFRRPLTPVDLARLMKVYDGEIAAGEKPLAAFKTTLVSILCSKDFLYLVEGCAERRDGKLNAWELASRLSYFLWSTMPDDTLFAAARDGSLTRPEVLKAQFSRMLAHPKGQRFSEDFSRSWLQLRKLGTFPPDKTLYPDYSRHLEASMACETSEFFREVLDQDLTLREFLHSDWTMLNGRLAQHYGVPDVEGDEFRRVALAPEHHRGGVLTQAAILSLTSDGARHRPVHRGKWLAEAILGRTVPPPPGNVDPIEPTPPTQPKATLRQKLEAHKHSVSCAACHRKIDPLGLAFDHYDAIGRWRTEEVVKDGVGHNPPVDASGQLPDGRQFAEQDSFKQLLLADLDSFNAALAEKLAMFALRRTIAFDDRAELAQIAERSKAANYRLRDLVEAVVLSDLFQQR